MSEGIQGMAADADAALEAIRALHRQLASGRLHADFQPPAAVSHASSYAHQPERLKRYAKQVIGGRIMILYSFVRLNTTALLRTFLLGADHEEPFAMLLTSRAQLELLSLVADVNRVIKANSGEGGEDFAARVLAVDEALIGATYGTRNERLKEKIASSASKLREATERDLEVLKAKNVLTRLNKLRDSGLYEECVEDYERLCEYAHPNYGMNQLFVVASPLSPKLLRYSVTDRDPFERALNASAPVMARSAQATLDVLDAIQPPFGLGEVTYL